MGEKFKELFDEVNPRLEYSLQSFKREENVANTPELILNIRGFYQVAKNLLKDEGLAEEAKKLIEELEKSPIKFTPPEIVVAIIKV
jgi:SRSO17 transposase